MDDPPLLGAHRVHLDRAVAIERLLGSPISAGGQHLTPTLAIPGRIEHNPLAVPNSAKSRLVAEQLKRINRLPSLTNQQPVVLIADDGDVNPRVPLSNLNLTFKVELVENPFHKLPYPLAWLGRPISRLTHMCTLSLWGRGDRVIPFLRT